MARRRVDPHARDARLARRRAHRVGRRLLRGLPRGRRSGRRLARPARFDFLAAPLDDVRASFARLGCEQRLCASCPGSSSRRCRRWPASAGRSCASTPTPTRRRAGAALPLPRPRAGGYLILDDYGSFEGCRRAVDEFRAEHGITEPIEQVDSTCVAGGARPIEPAPARAARPSAPRPTARRPPAHVPSARELELEREVAALRERLAAAEGRDRARAWLRRRLGTERAA